MLKRVMMGLCALGAVMFLWTEADAGCATIAGKRMCASWIKGSAKCLASITPIETFGVLGRCEVGGTERIGKYGPTCGPMRKSSTGELAPCNLKGVLSCANQAAPSSDLRLLGGGHHDDDDNDGKFGGLFEAPRFIQRANVLVSDEDFDATKVASCDGNDCRVTHELDLDEETGERACRDAGLSGFDTFTPNKGFMRAEFCDGVTCFALVESCTTFAGGICGIPYLCQFVAQFDFPDPDFCLDCGVIK